MLRILLVGLAGLVGTLCRYRLAGAVALNVVASNLPGPRMVFAGYAAAKLPGGGA